MPSPFRIGDDAARAEVETKLAKVVSERLLLAAQHAVNMLEKEKAGVCVLGVDEVALYIDALVALDKLTQALSGNRRVAEVFKPLPGALAGTGMEAVKRA